MTKEDLIQAVIDGDTDEAVDSVKSLLDENTVPFEIVQEALIPAMDKVAAMWKEGEYFLSDVILCANAFGEAMNILTPKLQEGGNATKARFVMGVVTGDNHDLGKNIVTAMLRANGYEVIDIGINQPLEAFIDAVKKYQPTFLGIGAYMTTTQVAALDIIEELKKQGLRDSVKIVLGGVCITQEITDKYGADYWGKDALTTVQDCDRYLGYAS